MQRKQQSWRKANHSNHQVKLVKILIGRSESKLKYIITSGDAASKIPDWRENQTVRERLPIQ